MEEEEGDTEKSRKKNVRKYGNSKEKIEEGRRRRRGGHCQLRDGEICSWMASMPPAPQVGSHCAVIDRVGQSGQPLTLRTQEFLPIPMMVRVTPSVLLPGIWQGYVW